MTKFSEISILDLSEARYLLRQLVRLLPGSKRYAAKRMAEIDDELVRRDSLAKDAAALQPEPKP